jgi:hypothetical protein
MVFLIWSSGRLRHSAVNIVVSCGKVAGRSAHRAHYEHWLEDQRMRKRSLTFDAVVVAFMAAVLYASPAQAKTGGDFNCFYEWGEWPVDECFSSQAANEHECMAQLCEWDEEECEDCETESATCDDQPDPNWLSCTYRDAI